MGLFRASSGWRERERGIQYGGHQSSVWCRAVDAGPEHEGDWDWWHGVVQSEGSVTGMVSYNRGGDGSAGGQLGCGEGLRMGRGQGPRA